MPQTTTSADWTLAPVEPTPQQKALAQAVLANVLSGPVLRWANAHVIPSRRSDVGLRPADELVTLAGPESLPRPVWSRRDWTTPTVAADPVTWAAGYDVTPKAVWVEVRLTSEKLLDIKPFTRIQDGAPVIDPGPAFDPVLASTLGDALRVEVGRVFAASSNSNTDPVHAIAGYAGTNTVTLARPAGFQDLSEAYHGILASQRFAPTVAWTSPNSYEYLRRERDAGGNLIWKPTEPILLDTLVNPDGSLRTVPVLPVAGFPEGDTSTVIADGRAVFAVFREVYPDLLCRVERSDHQDFTTDRSRWRAMLRLDFGIPQGMGAAVTTIRHTSGV